MRNTIKILTYGYIGLSYSMELSAAGNLLEISAGRLVRRCLQQSSHIAPRARFFSSGVVDGDWNTGHVPVRKPTVDMLSKGSNQLNIQQKGSVLWHFDAVRSLYYRFKNGAIDLFDKQNTEIKKPIQQDDDMVVYSVPTQKKV